MKPIGVVDVFAGPGGLGEGFCPVSAGASWPFEMAASIEKDHSAHETLLLRSFLRKFGGEVPAEYYDFLNGRIAEPDWKSEFPYEWGQASEEAKCLTLGDPITDEFLREKIPEIRRRYGDRTVLLGGPPCQAYSLAGRVRNASISGYLVHKDERTRLYEKYIDVLKLLEPAFFVMENVKGMLSATSRGVGIFERVIADLESAGDLGYKLFPLAAKRDENQNIFSDKASRFVVRAEEFGVPQARHRVIVVGIRSDLARDIDRSLMHLEPSLDRPPTVSDIIGGLPKLRTGISRRDSLDAWRSAMRLAAAEVTENVPRIPEQVQDSFHTILKENLSVPLSEWPKPRESEQPVDNPQPTGCLQNWIEDGRLAKIPNHMSRAHMPSDLSRYLFASIFAKATSRSPKARDFPPGLAPAHRNWQSGRFADRFRVQLSTRHATTITSHISKDGHYYIHYDPLQCRSLTVREAARLQTFPDNYLFKGNRTQQYVQVGNAVPPFLSHQIAQIVRSAFFALGRVEKDASTSSSRLVAAS